MKADLIKTKINVYQGDLSGIDRTMKPERINNLTLKNGSCLGRKGS